MNSRLLANLLLEVDVINTKDIDREINKLAARIYDPRGQEWMRRVGRYFVINVEELMKPAELEPEKPGIRGSKFYHHPQQGWTKDFKGDPAAARTHKIPDWFVLQNPEQPEQFWSPKGWGELTKAKKFKHSETATKPAEGEWVNWNVASNKYLPQDEVYYFAHPDDQQLFLDIKRPFDAKNQTWVGIEDATPVKNKVDMPFAGKWFPSSALQNFLRRPSQGDTRDRFYLVYKPRHGVLQYWNDSGGWQSDPSAATRYSAHDAKRTPPRRATEKMMASDGKARYISAEISKGVTPEQEEKGVEQFEAQARRLTRRVLGEADDEDKYTTSLNAQPEWGTTGGPWGKPVQKDPLWTRVKNQSYKEFNPKKAAAKSLYGEPPSKKELEPWMLTGDRQRYHFDPLTVYQQEIWSKLQDIADYLNYLYALKNQATSTPEYVYQSAENPNLYWNEAGGEWVSQADADTFDTKQKMPEAGHWINVREQQGMEAEAVLKALQQMRPNDVSGFRRIFTDAQEFIRTVKERPQQFVKDMKRLAVSGNLSLIRAVHKNSVQKLAKRNPHGCSIEGSETSWCIRASHYETYSKYGPFYFVDKDRRPYALIHWGSGQAKDTANNAITPEMATEIAPLFVKAGIPSRDMVPVPASGYSDDGGLRRLRDAMRALE